MPSSRGSPKPGIETMSPTLWVDSLLSEPPGKPWGLLNVTSDDVVGMDD